MHLTTFSDLNLDPTLLKALAAKNYVTPTPIQAQAIPYVLEGRDVLGIAQTGTGKTAAFALPILQRLAATRQKAQPRTCRVLVLSPTRELASQIAESFRDYGAHLGLSTAVVFGGVSDRPQAERLARGVDILVATPGRLIDHLDQRNLRLDDVSIFVLDEADQMLDMGFIHAIRRLVPKLPKVRQNLFFSATMPREIGALAGDLLRDPAKVSVTPVASTVERIDQRVIFVETARKRTILSEILRDDKMGRTLVFTRTKHGADKVVRGLDVDGISSAAIHGNKSQNQRERALAGFKAGTTKVLVATDIAARGIDISAVTHVINFDLPNVAESYVHRIGRTARAGADGSAISFCDGEERPFLRAIESLIRLKLPATDRRQPGAPAAPEPPHAPNRARPQGRPPARNHARPAAGARGATNGREAGDAHAPRPAGADKQWRRGRNRPKFENGRAPTPR